MSIPAKNKSRFSITLIGLIIAMLGIIAPISWDWWSKKSELSLTKDQNVSLIEKKTGVDGLSITYLGHEIDTLSKLVFTLKNTGRTPIEETDLVSPPTLKITQGELLNASIESMSPENIGSTIKKSGNSISIKFPLLNPDDSITFSILLSDRNPKYEVESRIKNISKITSLDEKDQIKIRSSFGFSVYITGTLIILFFVVLIGLLTEIPRKKRALKTILKEETPIKVGVQSNMAMSYIDNDLSFLTSTKRLKLKTIAQRQGAFLDEENTAELLISIKNDVENESPGGGAFVCFFIICVGIYYIYSSIVI